MTVCPDRLSTSQPAPAHAAECPATGCRFAYRLAAELAARHLRATGRWLLVIGGLLTGAAPAALGAADSPRVLLDQAISAFEEAVAQQHDPARALLLYRQAAGGFQALADSGVRSAALEYNLGTAYFRCGDTGRALLHYRRAADITPHDSKLQANLSHVRQQVTPQLEPSGESVLRSRLLGWQAAIPLGWRFRATAGASLLGWGCLGLWLWLRWPPLRPAGVVFVLLGLAGGTSAFWELRERAVRPPAVLLTGDQTLRKGRGHGADPAIRQALGAGVELEILQERGGWVEVRLVNGLSGWLPAEAIERI